MNINELLSKANALYEEKKYNEAIALYREAAEAGAPEGQYKLGKMYYAGRGVEKSGEEAVRYYTLSAEQGYEPAEFSLASAYQLGFDIEEDREKAFYWYGRAAEHGNLKAMLYMGYYCETGYGTEICLPKAMEWWKRALDASGGTMCEAAYKLGHYHYHGIDGKRDLMTARYYLTVANKNGYECGGFLERLEKEIEREKRK